MPLSVGERAFCAIEKLMQKIRADDGYRTDAGVRVFFQRQSVSVDQCPAIVIWDTGEDIGAASETLLSVGIEVHAVPNGDNTGKLLQAMKADVKRAIYGAGNNVAGSLKDEHGKFASIERSTANVFPRKDGATTESITMHFLVKYMEDLSAL